MSSERGQIQLGLIYIVMLLNLWQPGRQAICQGHNHPASIMIYKWCRSGDTELLNLTKPSYLEYP